MFRNNLRFLIVLTIAALALSVAPAGATTITTYNSLASWLAATSSGPQLIDFQGNAAGSYSGGFTINTVQFIGLSGGNGSPLGIIDTSIASWMNFGTLNAVYINTNSAPTPTIRIVLPVSVTAFGLNLFSANPNALTFTLTTLSTPFTIATNPTPTPAFFGATSDTPFNSIDVTLSGAPVGTYELLDNFRFGTSQIDQTPEAATFLLIGSGLVGLMALRKRIVKNKPDPRPLQNDPALSAY